MPWMRGSGKSGLLTDHLRSSKSPATNTKNKTEITPFMVKNAAFSFDKSLG
jgi:hypothetical protein